MIFVVGLLSCLEAQKGEQEMYFVKNAENMTFERLTIWIAGHEIEQYVGK